MIRLVLDYVLKGYVILLLEGKWFESCVVVCDSIDNCFSINYYILLKKCELNNKMVKWYVNDLRVIFGVVYLDILLCDYILCVDWNLLCFVGKCVFIFGFLVIWCLCDGNVVVCYN